MQNVPKLTVSIEEAEVEYEKYLKAVKTNKEKYLEDLKKVYHAIKNGKKIIDIYAVMNKYNVNEEHQPKLAIAVAGKKKCIFTKQDYGAGWFETDGITQAGNVELPAKTFLDWSRFSREEDDNAGNEGVWARGKIKEIELETSIPIVPAHLLPEGNLGRYFILWEVEEWSATPEPPVDPFLLRRINSNMFIVMAEWDLSPIEQAISKNLE